MGIKYLKENILGNFYKIINQLHDTCAGFYRIASKKQDIRQKTIIMLTMARIEFKNTLVKIFSLHPVHEQFLNYNIIFPEYTAFRNMLRDIFVFEEYAFNGPSDAFIIDCGSNIGISILYFKKTHPYSTILAFEPDQLTYDKLVRNIEVNKLNSVYLNRSAVFDKEGEIIFYSAKIEDEESPLEMSAFPSSLENRELISTAVPCSKLSTYINQPVDLVKLDIQGAETKVIENLAIEGKLGLIKEFIIEYHYDPINNSLGKLVSILEENRYFISIHDTHKKRTPPHYQYLKHPYTLIIFASRAVVSLPSQLIYEKIKK